MCAVAVRSRLHVRVILALSLLVALVAEPDTAAAQGEVHFPAEDSFATLLFEDSWPSRGDFDFNDVVAGVNLVVFQGATGEITGLQYTLNVTAIGAGFIDSGLALHLPAPSDVEFTAELIVDGVLVRQVPADAGESDLVLWITDDLRGDLCDGAEGFINTYPREPLVDCPSAMVTIDFPDPPPLDTAELPFDLFFFHSGNRGHQVHRPEYGGTDIMDTTLFGTEDDASVLPDGPFFVSESTPGLPFIILIDEESSYPREDAQIDDAFPNVTDFYASGGVEHQDWYLHPDPALIYYPPLDAPVFYPGPGESVTIGFEDELLELEDTDEDVNDLVTILNACVHAVEPPVGMEPIPGEEVALTGLVYVYSARHVGANLDNGLYHRLPIPYDPANAPSMTRRVSEPGSTGNAPIDTIETDLPVIEDGGLIVFKVLDDTREPFDGAPGFIHTDPAVESPTENRIVEITLEWPAPELVRLDELQGDPFILRSGTGFGTGVPGYEVHLTDSPIPGGTTEMDPTLPSDFVLPNGAPAGVLIPLEGFQPPQEGIDILLAYPVLHDDIINGTSSDWWNFPEPSLVYVADASGDSPPAMRFPADSLFPGCFQGEPPECTIDDDCPPGLICLDGTCFDPGGSSVVPALPPIGLVGLGLALLTGSFLVLGLRRRTS